MNLYKPKALLDVTVGTGEKIHESRKTAEQNVQRFSSYKVINNGRALLITLMTDNVTTTCTWAHFLNFPRI